MSSLSHGNAQLSPGRSAWPGQRATSEPRAPCEGLAGGGGVRPGLGLGPRDLHSGRTPGWSVSARVPSAPASALQNLRTLDSGFRERLSGWNSLSLSQRTGAAASPSPGRRPCCRATSSLTPCSDQNTVRGSWGCLRGRSADPFLARASGAFRSPGLTGTSDAPVTRSCRSSPGLGEVEWGLLPTEGFTPSAGFPLFCGLTPPLALSLGRRGGFGGSSPREMMGKQTRELRFLFVDTSRVTRARC